MTSSEEVCQCGHKKSEHKYHEENCGAWRRYPEVLNARQCGCKKFLPKERSK